MPTTTSIAPRVTPGRSLLGSILLIIIGLLP